MQKTNAVRILESAGIRVRTIEYPVDENDLSGEHASLVSGVPAETMYKTLVGRGEKRGILVFLIPVANELSLKKAAAAAGDKSVRLVSLKELTPLTGYLRGGCSPVGMKKKYPTFLDETALSHAEISVSAGLRGCQMLLPPGDLARFAGMEVCDLIDTNLR